MGTYMRVFDDLLMGYDCVGEEGKKVGIRREEDDGLLWIGVRQGASAHSPLRPTPHRPISLQHFPTYTLHAIPPTHHITSEQDRYRVIISYFPFHRLLCLWESQFPCLADATQHHTTFEAPSHLWHILESTRPGPPPPLPPQQHTGTLPVSPIQLLGLSSYSNLTHPIILAIHSHFHHRCITRINIIHSSHPSTSSFMLPLTF
ncbi:hypothetical protein GGR51DRAFT_114071 [Nemania sp. FL0031]|nr:hypothetical protein GGR51DRAFT_114071 [Nemania sp. FL0031]